MNGTYAGNKRDKDASFMAGWGDSGPCKGYRWLVVQQEWDPTFIANVMRDGIILFKRGRLPAPFAA